MLIYLSMIESEADKTKFEKMYILYRPAMFYAANKILNNTRDAEDAVHQSFLKIAEMIEHVDDSIPDRLKGLLLTIVRHYATDMYRKKKKHPTFDLSVCDEMYVTYEGSNDIAKCLNRLPESYLTVLLLKHHYGYTTREIGKILNMTEANVYKTLKRAKEKLEKLCREEGVI